MKALIRNGQRFDRHFYDKEDHYEAIVKREIQNILPNFWVIDFKQFVMGAEGIRRKADLALVEKNYRMWVVVEVELIHHSLDHHVMPQMRGLVTGDYNETHAKYLSDLDERLDPDRMLSVVTYKPPAVMVIVNSTQAQQRWSILHSELGVKLGYLETYRDDTTGDSIFVYEGFHPAVEPSRVAGARKQNMLNALICDKVTDQPLLNREVVQMFFDERPIVWKVVPTVNEIVLIPQQPVDLTDKRNYEIRLDSDGDLLLTQL